MSSDKNYKDCSVVIDNDERVCDPVSRNPRMCPFRFKHCILGCMHCNIMEDQDKQILLIVTCGGSELVLPVGFVSTVEDLKAEEVDTPTQRVPEV